MGEPSNPMNKLIKFNENRIIEEFSYNGISVRILYNLNNEPWFVGKDVCNILKYSNQQKALRDHVIDEFKIVFKGGEHFVHPLNLDPQTILISEPGLYSLMLRSKLPSAKEFQKWVCSEVLVNIRKYGEYKIAKEKDVIIKTREDKIDELIDQLKKSNAKADETNEQLKESNLETKKLRRDIKRSNKDLEDTLDELRKTREELSEVNNKLENAVTKVPRAINIVKQYLFVIELGPSSDYDYYIIRSQLSHAKSKLKDIKKEYPGSSIFIRLNDEPNPIKFKQDFISAMKVKYGNDFKNKLNYFSVKNEDQEDLKEFIMSLDVSRGDHLL